MLPRDEVQALVSMSPNEIKQGIQKIDAVIFQSNVRDRPYVDEQCDYRWIVGCLDEFLIPSLLSIHYAQAGQGHPSRGVQFFNSTLTSNTGFFFDSTDIPTGKRYDRM